VEIGGHGPDAVEGAGFVDQFIADGFGARFPVAGPFYAGGFGDFVGVEIVGGDGLGDDFEALGGGEDSPI
jgi:hypothetical protein